LKISLGQQRAPKDTSVENTESPQDQSSEKAESAQTGESPFATMNLSLEPVGDESEAAEEAH
jgi:hypothetical protein